MRRPPRLKWPIIVGSSVALLITILYSPPIEAFHEPLGDWLRGQILKEAPPPPPPTKTSCPTDEEIKKEVAACKEIDGKATVETDKMGCQYTKCNVVTPTTCPSEEKLNAWISECKDKGLTYDWTTEGKCRYVKCVSEEIPPPLPPEPPPKSDCEMLREKLGRLGTDHPDYKPMKEKYVSLCEDEDKGPCPALESKLRKTPVTSPEYEEIKRNYEKLCLRVPIKPPQPPERDACEELRHLMVKLSEAGEEGSSEFKALKEKFLKNCAEKYKAEGEDLCTKLREHMERGGYTHEEKQKYIKLCEGGEPVLPTKEDFCKKMRRVLEEGTYTEEEKRTFYETCFEENEHVKEKDECKELRHTLVKLSNADLGGTDEYAELKEQFIDLCEEPEGHVPPAGFEDEVLVDYSAYTNPFPDTDLESEEGQSAAELYRRGVIGGFPDGEFKGDRDVNRAEAAKFLLLACNLSTEPSEAFSGGFRDVLQKQWYTGFVEAAAEQGVISGHPDGTFRPADTVQRDQFLKMLTLACDLETDLPYSYPDVDPDDWFAMYAGVAEQYRIYETPDGALHPAELLTREEVTTAIYRFLQAR